MLEYSSNTAYIKNKDGEWESIPALRGESIYDIAVRNGYLGSEDDFIKELLSDGWVNAFLELDNKKIDKKDVYTRDETLLNATKPLYGLTDAGVPDDIFKILANSIVTKESGTEDVGFMKAWKEIVFEHNIFKTATNGNVLVGIHYGVSSNIVYSYDGLTWEKVDVPEANYVSIIYDGAKFIALSSTSEDIGVTSTDGVIWSSFSVSNTGLNPGNLMYTNGIYAYSDTNIGYYSTNLTNWSTINTTYSETYGNIWNLTSMVCGNGKFVVLGISQVVGFAVGYTTDFLKDSSDQTIWTKSNISDGTGWQVQTLKFANGYFYIYGLNTSTNATCIFKSADLDVWEFVDTSLWPVKSLGTDFGYSDGRYYLYDSYFLYTTTDFSEWTYTYVPSVIGAITNITYAGYKNKSFIFPYFTGSGENATKIVYTESEIVPVYDFESVIGNEVPLVGIESGEYFGTGVAANATNPISLTFNNIEPHLIMITSLANTNTKNLLMLFRPSIYGMTLVSDTTMQNIYVDVRVTWGKNSVSWFGSDSTTLQCNNSEKYVYTAIGIRR